MKSPQFSPNLQNLHPSPSSYIASIPAALVNMSFYGARVWSHVSRRTALDRSKILSQPHTVTRYLSVTSKMSAPPREWLVTVPDKPNALQKRLGARPDHLKNLKPDIDAGRVVFGGAILSKQPSEGESPDMQGSVMLIRANSKEEVLERLKADEYTKQGAWDVENATITPFRCAVRTAL